MQIECEDVEQESCINKPVVKESNTIVKNCQVAFSLCYHMKADGRWFKSSQERERDNDNIYIYRKREREKDREAKGYPNRRYSYSKAQRTYRRTNC